jgi:hypothetical protein
LNNWKLSTQNNSYQPTSTSAQKNITTQSTLFSNNKQIRPEPQKSYANIIQRSNPVIPHNRTPAISNTTLNNRNIPSTTKMKDHKYLPMADKSNDQTNNIDNNNFQIVKYGKKKSPIFGKKTNADRSIAGSRTPRRINIFIGGVDPSLSADSFFNHLQENLHIEPVYVECNRNNKYNQSFCVTVNAADKTKIFDPNLWEENIIIKPFHFPKSGSSFQM